MGYRHYFYKVEKDLLEQINNMNKEEFFNWGCEVGIIDNSDSHSELPLYKIGENFYGFGKYYDHAKEIIKDGIPLFKDVELTENYDEYEPFIVGKSALLNVIEYQKSLIVKYYENILFRTDEERFSEDFDDRSKEKVYEHHVMDMYKEWKNKFNISAINLNENSEEITNSWKYEYSIFELVRLYKSTDWNRYGLIFMGW